MSNNSDIVFTPSARRAQVERGSADRYDKRIAAGFPERVTAELAAFIAELDTAFLATVSAAGAPYIQHRGGPKGFIKVLDDKTLGFADYAGNRQYITISNLADNDRAYLFLLDFAARRIKVWGRARAVEDDQALLARLADPNYRARPERAILFTVEAWDVNCPSTLPRASPKPRLPRPPLCCGSHRGAGSGECAAASGGGRFAGIDPRACDFVITAPFPNDRAAPMFARKAVQSGMNHDSYDDGYIRGILNTVKTIAMVGVSANTSRPSYFAFKYLHERGYRMIPVNPGLAGQELLGRKAYAKLADIPEPVDMVDIFRASQYALPIVQEALALTPRPQVIWMQLGVRNDEAARLAEATGLKVVMNRCPKIEYGRLSSEIAWMGVNTRTITAKKAQLFGRGIQRMALNRSPWRAGRPTLRNARKPTILPAVDRLTAHRENSSVAGKP